MGVTVDNVGIAVRGVEAALAIAARAARVRRPRRTPGVVSSDCADAGVPPARCRAGSSRSGAP